MPENVTTIGGGAFYYCSSLKRIISRNTVPPTIINSPVMGQYHSGVKVYVPKESIGLYSNARYWDYFSCQQFLPLEELEEDPDVSAVEETEAMLPNVHAVGGRVYCDEEFRIMNFAGQDITALNDLQGAYIVIAGNEAVKVYVD